MTSTIQVTTPPASDQVYLALADAKAHLREDATDQDSLITSLILAAGRRVEGRTQRRYLAQSLTWIVDGWAGERRHRGRHHSYGFSEDFWRWCRLESGWHGLRMPIAPGGDSANMTIDAVTYTDETGTVQTLDPSMWLAAPSGQTVELRYARGVQLPCVGPGAQPVAVKFSVKATIVPPEAAHAMRLLTSHYFRNTDAVVASGAANTPLPEGVEALLWTELWD